MKNSPVSTAATTIQPYWSYRNIKLYMVDRHDDIAMSGVGIRFLRSLIAFLDFPFQNSFLDSALERENKEKSNAYIYMQGCSEELSIQIGLKSCGSLL